MDRQSSPVRISTRADQPGQFRVNYLPEVVRDEMTEAQKGWKVVKEQKEILSWIYG